MLKSDGRGGVTLSNFGEYVCLGIAVVSFIIFLILFVLVKGKKKKDTEADAPEALLMNTNEFDWAQAILG